MGLTLVLCAPLPYQQRYIVVSLSSDKRTYSKSLLIKASAKCPHSLVVIPIGPMVNVEYPTFTKKYYCMFFYFNVSNVYN